MPKKEKRFTQELEDDLVSNSKDTPEQITAEYRAMAQTSGWSRTTALLDVRIKSMTDEILDTDTQGEDLNRLRDRRDLLLWFRNLPELVAKSFTREVEPSIQEFDPYPQRPEIDNPDEESV